MNQENKSNKKIIIIIVVILLCALIVFLLLNRKKSNNSETSNSNLNSDVSIESNVENDSNGAFLMPIEDVFKITGRGTVATGRIERGKVSVGDKVQIVGFSNEVINTEVVGIELYRKQLDYAEVGDNAGLLLKDVNREDIQRGQVIVKPNSIKATKKFVATIDILSKEEGGKADPFENNQKKSFYFRTADVDGILTLSNGSKVDSGTKNVTINVELKEPIALEKGTGFNIREGGRVVAKGTVTAVN